MALTKKGLTKKEKHILHEFGKRVRERRRNLGIKATDLSQKMGYCRTYVYEIEAGDMRVSLYTLWKLEEQLGLLWTGDI